MADTSQLARIAELVQRLGPLAKKQRGMRIEAQDWNALVDVLLGILTVDSAQEKTAHTRLEESYAPKTHEHLGQVNIAWLDPELQASRGDGASVFARTALAEVNQKIAGLGAEVARLTSLAEAQQKAIDRAAVDEVDRARALRDFEIRFAGVADLRTLVTSLAGQMDGIRGNISTLLELRQSLSDPQGNPIDVGKMRQELTDLAALQDNLKGVDGAFLPVRNLELKIKELADAVGIGGPGGLDARLAQLSGDMEGRLNKRVDEKSTAVREELLAANAASETRLRGELTAQVETSRSSLAESVTAQVKEAETRLNAGLDSKVAAAADQVRQDTLSLMDQRLAEVPGQIKAQVDAAATALESRLGSDLRQSLTADLNTRVGAVEARLNDRLATMENRVAVLQEELPGRVESSVAQAVGQVEKNLAQRLDAQVSKMQQGLETNLVSLVKTTVTDSLSNLDQRIDARVDQRLSDLDVRIGQAVAAATSRLPDQVSAEVKRQLTEQDLVGQFQRFGTQLTTQWRSDLAQAMADQQARTSTAVNEAVALLQNQVNSAVGNLREELVRTMDVRLKKTQEVMAEQFSQQLKAEITRTNTAFTAEIKRLDDRIGPRGTVITPR